jgi:hypothetical protein
MPAGQVPNPGLNFWDQLLDSLMNNLERNQQPRQFSLAEKIQQTLQLHVNMDAKAVLAILAILIIILTVFLLSKCCSCCRCCKRMWCVQRRTRGDAPMNVPMQTVQVFNNLSQPTLTSKTEQIVAKSDFMTMRQATASTVRSRFEKCFFRYGLVQAPPMYERTMKMDTWLQSFERYVNANRIYNKRDVLLSLLDPECASAVDDVVLSSDEEEAYEELRDVLIKLYGESEQGSN